MNPKKEWRPLAHVKKYKWITANGEAVPGIAIMHRHKVLAHLTPDEARAMADQLHDYADRAEQDGNTN